MSTSPFVTGVVTRVKNALTEDQERALRDELARVESANLDGKFTESLNDLVEKRLMQMVSDRRAAGGPQGGCDDDIDTLASNSDFVLPFLKQLLNEYQRGNWPKKATALTVNMGTIVSGITGAQRAEKEAELLAGMKGVASVTTDSDQAPIRSENIETLIHSRPTGMDTTEVGRGNLTVAESPDKGWFCESCNRAVYEFACKSCGSTINNRIRNGRRPRLKPGQWECWGADCNYLNYKQHSICRKCGRDKNVEEDDTWPDKRQVFEPLDPLLDAPQKEFDFAAERLKTEALKVIVYNEY
ncbi:hypothetical protein Pmar_PMAR015551 [Perkinsus marinus ATCC 50983]|uniref:RanBP2-type domain-containing protein n=1 Tax=Perkinsus marinus (strain ATCC 50983 / TXsc) TaxID=423536 RepID=C5KUF7_PERM5|nr:hypothetical protein Pmar_PMAR015551 [Perkinsus marinus ATCC 50983]EER11844.1 hypothetical protein Pmar_PMAR015551 [Perkinsus marinus ATCC 50983]|eukprot:XP_002780049.1 hypothetical protein Pmar_PMAR015551 [Perkinsus marinus ATCC 50983]